MKEIDIDIVDFGINGEGIGKYEGLAVFVPGAVPGDKARVLLNKVKKGYGFGRLVKLLKYSSSRETPVCGSFGSCGGCCFLHTKYGTELEFKKKKVNDAFKRIGGLDFEIDELAPMTKPHYYRNKAVYHVSGKDGEILIGFYGAKTNNVVPAKGCVLVPPLLRKHYRLLS